MKGFGSCWTIRVPTADGPNNQSLAWKTKSVVKSPEDNADDTSPFSRLPDDIILQILNKVIDLKSLCLCSLVSKRFSSIVPRVDAVSFTAPLLKSPSSLRQLINGAVVKLLRRNIAVPSNPVPIPPILSSFYCKSFESAIRSLKKFKGVKSFFLELPNSRHKVIYNSLYKWKVQFGTTIESFFFLSPNSISNTEKFHVIGNGEEEVEDMEISNDQLQQKLNNAFQCLEDMITRHIMLWFIARDLPMLEEVSITESGRRGRLSINGGKLSAGKKEWGLSKLYRIGICSGVKHCYIPVLKLPVSGYVMKGVTLIVMEMNGFQIGDGDDSLMNSEYGYEDKEEAAYTETVMQILENHKGMMKELPRL